MGLLKLRLSVEGLGMFQKLSRRPCPRTTSASWRHWEGQESYVLFWGSIASLRFVLLVLIFFEMFLLPWSLQ